MTTNGLWHGVACRDDDGCSPHSCAQQEPKVPPPPYSNSMSEMRLFLVEARQVDLRWGVVVTSWTLHVHILGARTELSGPNSPVDTSRFSARAAAGGFQG